MYLHPSIQHKIYNMTVDIHVHGRSENLILNISRSTDVNTKFQLYWQQQTNNLNSLSFFIVNKLLFVSVYIEFVRDRGKNYAFCCARLDGRTVRHITTFSHLPLRKTLNCIFGVMGAAIELYSMTSQPRFRFWINHLREQHIENDET